MGFGLDFCPTVKSFGVSAQIGSGVVRGGPGVRFHEGSTRVPTKVPPRFHQVLQRAAGWSGVVRQGFTRVSAEFHEFHEASTRVQGKVL